MGIFHSKTEKLKFYLENEALESIYPPPSTEIIKTKSSRPIRPALQNVRQFVLHAQPVGGYTQSTVNAFDGRIKVEHPERWPYSVHGVVAIIFEGENKHRWGTGTLIGPNIVLTAGHNLYSHDYKTFAELKSMQFIPGINGRMPHFDSLEVQQYFVSEEYVSNDREDYGILILKVPIGERTGYFGLSFLKPEDVRGKVINVTCYPGDKVQSEEPKRYEMWGMGSPDGYVEETGRFISYPIDTAGGQSGSGIWYQENDEYYICGIHVHGYAAFSQGTFLTKRIYEQIYSWIKQAAFKEYTLGLGETKKLEFKNIALDANCLLLLMKYKLDDLAILDLSNQDLAEKGALVLAKNTSWKKLSDLNLSKNRLHAKGIGAIAQNTSWINLSKLDLSENSITKEGAAVLAKNQSWVSLSHLNLAWNSLHAEGVAELAQNRSWKNLSHLDLSYNLIEAEGALKLAQNTVWKELSSLNLQWNSFGAFGATVLTKNTFWTKLSHLDMSKNDISQEQAQALSHNIHYNSLILNAV